jgi:hypothetical protein
LFEVDGPGLGWQATTQQPWLTFNPTSGVAPSWVNVQVNPAGLPAGTYDGKITLTNNLRTNTVDFGVRFEITQVKLEPSDYLIGYYATTETPSPDTAYINLSNGQSANWTAQAQDPWVILDKYSGTTPDQVKVSYLLNFVPIAGETYKSTIAWTSSYAGVSVAATSHIELHFLSGTASRAVAPSNPGAAAKGSSEQVDSPLPQGQPQFTWAPLR